MQDKLLRVLMVDDSEDDVLLIIRELKKGGYNPVYERIETAAAMKKALREKQWDIILCDYKMPKFNAPSAIALFKEANTGIPFIVISGTIGEETAAECVRLGAHDYFMKGKLSRLCPAIAREIEYAKVRNKHRHAEELLYKSENKYRTILEDIREGYFEVDLAGNFTFFNDTVCRVMGYTREELMGMNNRYYTDKEELKKVFQAYNKVYTTGEPDKELVWQITRKDGTKRYIEGFISLLKDSSGKPTGFRGIAHDITERKQTEAALRREQQFSKSVLDNLPGIFYLYTYPECRLVLWNKQHETLLGFNTGEIKDRHVTEWFAPEHREAVLKAIQRVMEKGQNYEEVPLLTKDGHQIPFFLPGVRFETDGRLYFMGIGMDISEIKKAKKIIKQSEEKYRLLADHMKDQVWLMDLNLKITYVSPSVERLTGYSSDEIKKMPWDKLLTPESLKKAVEFTSIRMPKAIKASSKDLAFRTLELEFILKGGQTVWGECSFSFIRDDNGKVMSILGEARNITDRKQAEEKLQQTLDSLKRAIGTTIQVLVSALECRDPYTAGHQSQSANLACAIAMEMGLSQDKVEGIRMAGSIHDIGKLSIPAEILTKPTKLTNIEFSLIKEHPISGYEMLKDVESPWPLAQIVYQHHERMNGTGYPRNLKGNEIILEARIMAVADVVDAMASHRPYRASLGMEAALQEIEENKGILYDYVVVEACLRLIRGKGYKLT